jgi:hypothetical protein
VPLAAEDPTGTRGASGSEPDGIANGELARPTARGALAAEDEAPDGGTPNADGLAPNAVGLAPNAVGLPPNAFELSPNAVGLSPNAVGLPPNAVGLPPNAVGLPPKADAGALNGDARSPNAGTPANGELATLGLTAP